MSYLALLLRPSSASRPWEQRAALEAPVVPEVNSSSSCVLGVTDGSAAGSQACRATRAG